MYVLDTNVVSELRKVAAGKADPGVSRWIGSIGPDETFVSAITIEELERGVLFAERRDAEQGAMLRRWLDGSVIARFADWILPIGDRVARVAASLQVPDPAPFRDAFIGATALVEGFTVVTRNEADFRRFRGLAVLNPWNG